MHIPSFGNYIFYENNGVTGAWLIKYKLYQGTYWWSYLFATCFVMVFVVTELTEMESVGNHRLIGEYKLNLNAH